MTWTLITGASEGLGREFAILAAADGHNLVLSARQEAKLQSLAADLRARHRIDCVVIPADLAQPGEADRLWQAATTGRTVSVLVNNAGLGRNGAFSDPAGWPREEATLAVNVTALTVLMKRAAVAMAAAGQGRILNVASVAGFLPGPQMAVYHATKAYVLSLSEAVAEELRGTRVTVTALCPGATQTEFFRADGADKATLLTRMPLPTAASVARAGWLGLQAGRRIVVPGLNNKVSTFLPRFLPRALTNRITGMLLQRR